MGSIDGLKEQVEELKQRLNDPGPQKASKPDELKTRLASIKASLESKQGEITELLAEKQRFAAEIKRLAAENKRFAADQERLAAERQQLSAENDQLRKMLKDVLTALDGQLADASTNIISELRRGGYKGTIDIEGWHDPVYVDELEMTGQVHALKHLKSCRGNYVANPEGF